MRDALSEYFPEFLKNICGGDINRVKIEVDDIVDIVCKSFPNKSACFHTGSSNSDLRRYREFDIDILILINDNFYRRSKVTMEINGYIVDLTVVFFIDFKIFIEGEAAKGHYDIPSGIISGRLVFQNGENLAESMVSISSELINNGHVKYQKNIEIELLRNRITFFLFGMSKCRDEFKVLKVLSAYPYIYRGYMINKGYWPCAGAYRQLSEESAREEILNPFKSAMDGDFHGIINFASSVLNNLGGKSFGKLNF